MTVALHSNHRCPRHKSSAPLGLHRPRRAHIFNVQPIAHRLAGRQKKETDDKEVPVDPSNPDKKLWIRIGLEAK
jgi:hypothetical protein